VGYQAPDAGYQAHGSAAHPDVGRVIQGVGQLGIGGPQLANHPGNKPAVLNQLYPTDLLNQPLNAAELELPPPPIVLPPNVSRRHACTGRS
jgi:protein transport protein SEC24